jgi:cytochrome c
MKTIRLTSAANLMNAGAATGLLSLPSSVEAAATDGTQLAPKYNCHACMPWTRSWSGRPYKDVAAKYAGDSAALARLEQKVKNGGSGVWGAIPMPPNNVPDADLKALVEWMLALK